MTKEGYRKRDLPKLTDHPNVWDPGLHSQFTSSPNLNSSLEFIKVFTLRAHSFKKVLTTLF